MNMEKKNYSDWLVVSDIDGTLLNKIRKIPEANKKAVNRFVHELSGNFTLGSARNVQSLSTHYKNLPGLTTPAIVMNGAGIYDFKKREMIWFNAIPDSGAEVVRKCLEKFRFLEVSIFTDDMIYLIRPRIASPIMMWLDKLRHKKVKTVDEVPKGRWGKVVFFCLPWQRKEVRRFADSVSDENVGYIDTTIASFDLVNKTTNKGTAVAALAEILGINEDKIGVIGDYYNDWDMLSSVKHSACPKQAPQDIHELCEFHACHCNDGAVADFLSYIENTY